MILIKQRLFFLAPLFSKLENHHLFDIFAPIWNPQNKAFFALLFFGSTIAQMRKGPFPGSSIAFEMWDL